MPFFLVFLLAVLAAVPSGVAVAAPAPTPPRLSTLATRLVDRPEAIVRDHVGQAALIFGISVSQARVLLLPVSRERSLPAGYQPPDLTWAFTRPVRAVIADDLRAMIDAAAGDSVELTVVSGYRSPSEQVEAFDATVGRALGRNPGWGRAEAESWTSRFVAPPGHSQHQLGTAVDLSSYETGYALTPWFTETALARWIAEHAWAYGFVIPYTLQGEARTGYGYEPWHVRWVGRPLATLMQSDNYLDQPELVADDYLRALEELMDAEAVP